MISIPEAVFGRCMPKLQHHRQTGAQAGDLFENTLFTTLHVDEAPFTLVARTQVFGRSMAELM